MATQLRFLGISGSLRKQSLNTALLRNAQDLLPGGVTLEMADLSVIPLYNGDIEATGIPESVMQLRRQVEQADAVVLATPEYNYSIPAVMKNAIDWLTRSGNPTILSGKPVAVMGAGGGMGTSRAQYHLRQVLVYTNALVINKPEVFVTQAAGKFDAEGRLHDEPTRAVLAEMLASLADWSVRLKK